MNVCLGVNLLSMMYNEVTYFFKIKAMLPEIQTFNVEKKHCKVRNVKIN